MDPRPYAVGSIRGTFERYPHLTNLLPAMGYSVMQRQELEETIRRTPCDLVLIATPIDLARVIKLDRPNLRVTYEVEELTKPGLRRIARQVHARARAGAGRSRKMNSKDFFSIRDFSPSEIQYLLVLGRQVKADPTAYSTALRRETLAMIFEKPSLRTRVTFDVGIQQLGGFSLYLSPAEINLGKRESVYDVAKNLERMVQGIMIRTFAHEIVVEDGALRQHSRDQWINRLQPSLPGDGRLPHYLGGQRPSGGSEDCICRRREQRSAFTHVCRSPVRRACLAGHASGVRT